MKLKDYQQAYEQNKKDYELQKEFYSACYKAYFQSIDYKGEINDRALYEEVDVDTIKKYAKIYTIDFLEFTEEEYEYFKIKKYNLKSKTELPIRKTQYNNLLVELLGETEITNIVKIIDSSLIDWNLDYVKRRIYDFVIIYFPKKQYLINVLKNKINAYIEYKKTEQTKGIEQLKLEKENILYNCGKQYIEELVTSNYYIIEEFCHFNNIKVEFLKECIDVIEKKDERLYKIYLNKKQELDKNEEIFILSQLKELISYIKSGITDQDGTTRQFDIIDYYQIFGLSIELVYDYLEKFPFSRSEKLLIKQLLKEKENRVPFLKTNEAESESILRLSILNSVREIDCKIGKNGCLIPGTGRIIENHEKEKIMDYLKELNAPLNRRNYEAAFKRYKNNNLFLEEEKRHKYLQYKLKK